jgi:hypothetical protein
MRRTALVFCATFVLAVALSFTRDVSAQQPPVATAGARLAWDYADADIAAGAVVRFEMQVDAGAWSDVGMTKLAGAAATYAAPIPALQTGQHTVPLYRHGRILGDGCKAIRRLRTIGLHVQTLTVDGERAYQRSMS